jgi:hypothetical protein
MDFSFVDAAGLCLQHLGAHFLNLRLPDLIRHPGWCSLGLGHLDPLALEDVYLLCAFLPEPYVRVASVGNFQGCLAGRFSGEDADLIAFLVSQGEVSGLFFCHDESSKQNIELSYVVSIIYI